MRILMIGDVVGRPGRHACSQIIPRLIREAQVDFVVANAENAAGGSGITAAMFRKMLNYGVDVCTLGDHVYKRREIVPTLESSDRIVRPANLPPTAAGREWTIVEARNGVRVAVLTLLGRLFIQMRADCAFLAANRLLQQLPPDVKVVLVDHHAEASSEKIAMGWHLDGRVTAVVGTHTHVQTADERVLPKGAAYITDLGMTGPHDSVLGRNKDAVLSALLTTMPVPFDVATGDVALNGVMIECDPETGRSTSISRVSIAESSAPPSGEDD
ncbi:MAG: TIGR00282 family metallophosphoesterase [Phycisphaerales bacterium]|nr:TIGR00282 family metallophosphoesterase [Phycisphaerales bacterium]